MLEAALQALQALLAQEPARDSPQPAPAAS
jgi:hypothetical protein